MKSSLTRAIVVAALTPSLAFGMGSIVSDDSTRAASLRIVSARDGSWSDPQTWNPLGVPGGASDVVIRAGTTVRYDLVSDREFSSLEILGTLTFARDRSTRLDVGTVLIRAGGVLDMGTAQQPIPRGVTAGVRLVVPRGVVFKGGGFVPGDVGVWVFPGGRWEAHGAPVRHTWAKLARPARAGSTQLAVREDLLDWGAGADVVVTPSAMNPGPDQFEERRINSVQRLSDGLVAVTLNAPLAYAHDGGGEFRAEVALLSRNVRISSKYPDRTKAHTAFLGDAKGGIAYAEFKDLGALGVLGRYPIHFDQMGEASRGMTVRGASIWRSDNHFVNIHGSNGVTIEDTVGYDVAGSGFFVEEVAPASPHEGEHATPSPRKGSRRQEPPQRQRKRQGPAMNVDAVFIHNLAAKGIWRPGALDKPNVALFWMTDARNTVLIDNVAVGANGEKASAGFRLGGQVPVLVNNEAHGNSHDGMVVWLNAKDAFDIVGFRAWRNGKSGMLLGAYDPRYRVIRAQLAENGEVNVNAYAVRPWIQESRLDRSKIGILFNKHAVPGNPEDPARIISARFSGHEVADVSQDHKSCPSAEEEQDPASRHCDPHYVVFAGTQFLSQRAIDFGWHKNANTWFEVLDWPNAPRGLPPSFRIIRRDRNGEGGDFVPAFDARVQPLKRPWDYPPEVALSIATGRAGLLVLRAQPRDDRGIAAVEFFADGMLLKRLESRPYEITWSPGRDRRSYVYVRATDSGGNVAYSQIVSLGPASP